MDTEFESSNINALWLQNIYENIKNLENIERLAREGCSSVMEYMNIPYEHRPLIIGDVQFKNLKLMVTEIHLLLIDLTPILSRERLSYYNDALNKTGQVLKRRELFLEEPKGTNRVVKYSRTTEFFQETLDFLSRVKTEIIRDISHILYVKSERKEGFNR